jgi:hypothetical protein
MIRCLVFSKDRAMQLDAVLRSFFLNCLDADKYAVFYVIYKASNKFHAQQYKQLAHTYPHVQFIEQSDFRQDVIKTIISDKGGLLKNSLRTLLAGIGSMGFPVTMRADKVARRFFDPPRMRILKMLLPRNEREIGVLFLVDDNIFIRKFHLADMLDALKKNPGAIGFSLRLGKNTRYCYMSRKKQALPEFNLFSPDILKYTWTNAELDFSYPLEVSSSLYLTDFIAPIIMASAFKTPSEMETRIATRSFLFTELHPELLCFEQSVTFCNPINLVQTVYRNRAGEQTGTSANDLAELFAQGKRISLKPFDGFIPEACHQEVKFTFEGSN